MGSIGLTENGTCGVDAHTGALVGMADELAAVMTVFNVTTPGSVNFEFEAYLDAVCKHVVAAVIGCSDPLN